MKHLISIADLSREEIIGLMDEADRLITCAYSEDVEDARSAFLEKRVPHFTGR